MIKLDLVHNRYLINMLIEQLINMWFNLMSNNKNERGLPVVILQKDSLSETFRNTDKND